MKTTLTVTLTLVVLLAAGFVATGSESESLEKELLITRLTETLRDIDWVDKLTRAYFGSEITNEKLTLYLEQKLEKAPSVPNSKYLQNQPFRNYRKTLQTMKEAARKEKLIVLYKQLKTLREIKYEFVDAVIRLVFSNNQPEDN